MAGITYTIDMSGYEAVIGILDRWARQTSLLSLNRSLAAEVESQTRRRIEDERTTPDGTPWVEWSPRYALTRHSNNKLLQNEGDLVDSLNGFATAEAATIGSPLKYAAAQQFGRAEINLPARPYLGLSDENEEDVLDVVEDWVDQTLFRGL